MHLVGKLFYSLLGLARSINLTFFLLLSLKLSDEELDSGFF